MGTTARVVGILQLVRPAIEVKAGQIRTATYQVQHDHGLLFYRASVCAQGNFTPHRTI